MTLLRLTLLLALAGCATLPPCPPASVRVLEVEGQTLYVFDEESMDGLVKTIRGLDERTCRIEALGTL